jgi:hypothetical protein
MIDHEWFLVGQNFLLTLTFIWLIVWAVTAVKSKD